MRYRRVPRVNHPDSAGAKLCAMFGCPRQEQAMRLAALILEHFARGALWSGQANLDQLSLLLMTTQSGR